MLIDEALIKVAIGSGKLVPVAAGVPWAPEPRAFLMCTSLRDDLENGKKAADPKVRQRWARLEAAMQYFVEGGFVTEGLIKQLREYKHEHWELRSRSPRPSLRVFGRFACPDVFVGTHVVPRNGLGGMGSMEFEFEKLKCEDLWTAAGLPTTPPPGAFTDSPDFDYRRYITENAVRRARV